MFRRNKNYIIATPSALDKRLRKKKMFALFGLACFGLGAILVTNQWQPSLLDGQQLSKQASSKEDKAAQTDALSTQKVEPAPKLANINIDKPFLRNALGSYIKAGQFPSQLGYNDQNLYIDYTIDQDLQDWANARLARYNPDYGVFVALDPDTGKIIALASNRRDQQISSDLAFKATYPAASTFKLITAAAAIEEGIATPKTIFSFNGKSTSLYKTQVFQTKFNKWTRKVSLKTAFAKSVNPIFGRLGAKKIGGETLVNYAERFGFNAKFSSDFEFDNGSINIDLNDEWQAAEAASGYTRNNTLSPVHGAVLAASIANGGKLISPSIVESVTDAKNQVLYSSDQPQALTVLSKNSALAMQKLMRATISEGTGRRTFRTFSNKKKFSDIITGGKSGHLRGFEPKGSYDWFIGYGERNDKKIAYAVLCINKDKWYVKSARFAREALEHYFQQPENAKMATQPTTPQAKAS